MKEPPTLGLERREDVSPNLKEGSHNFRNHKGAAYLMDERRGKMYFPLETMRLLTRPLYITSLRSF